MFLQRAKDPTHYSQCKCESHKEEKDMKHSIHEFKGYRPEDIVSVSRYTPNKRDPW